jgi:hypothetical protein
VTATVVSRADVATLLHGWMEGRVNAAGVKEWVERSGDGGDPIVREVLHELDLLEVYLLTAEDAPALLAFLHARSFDEGLQAWTRYREAIDLDARSRALKKNRFYRPFCR